MLKYMIDIENTTVTKTLLHAARNVCKEIQSFQ